MISKTYILSANCILVKGYLRYALLDLQKNTLLLISNSLSKIISKPLKPNMLRFLSKSDLRIINELIRREALLLVPKSQVYLFQKLSTQFHNISEVNNFIIELNEFTLSFSEKIVESLNNLNCKFIEVRVLGEISITQLSLFLKKFSTTTIESISIYYEYKNEKTYSELFKVKKEIREIGWVYIYNTPEKFIAKINNDAHTDIIMIKKKIDSRNCGNISPLYFSINIPTYTESVNYNSCLNCKISIKGNGDINQCPSMAKNYGNISNTTLEHVITKKGFTKLGGIKKDDIKVCKDCEFRYVCSDCRAYIENPMDIYSKPLKCGYNPYTGEWEEWSANPSKQKAIKEYKMEHLITSKNK